MANEYQEALLNAMKVVAGQIVERTAMDKTVTATIVSYNNALTGEYKVSYNGGEMLAYANDGASYSENSTVYVLVPEGDFTKRKIIVGRATQAGDDANISFVSSALSGYNLIGGNTILDKNGVLPVGLFSYLANDQKFLYNLDDEDSLLQVDTDSLNTYMKQCDGALLIEIDVQTRLPQSHRLDAKGNYGIEFTLAFKDRNSTDIDFQKNLQLAPKINDNLISLKDELLSVWSDPNLTVNGEDIKDLETGVTTHKEGCRDKTLTILNKLKDLKSTEGITETEIKIIDFILNSEIKNLTPIEDSSSDSLTKSRATEIIEIYFVQNYKDLAIAYLSDEMTTARAKQQSITLLIQDLQSMLDSDNKYNTNEEYQQALINFISILSLASENFNNSTDGIEEALSYIKGQATVIKLNKYVLDCSSMTGNPYVYFNTSSQYGIFQIDVENFLYIDSIRVFSTGFEEEDNIKWKIYGEDIFIDNIEFYALNKITSVNGDYSLTMDYPNGSIFAIEDIPSTELKTYGVIKYKEQIISDSCTYYWFKEDARVTSSSEDWQAFGGAGWSWLKDKGNKYTFTTSKKENTAYENKYLCVGIYKESVILKFEFIIYNKGIQQEITVESDMGNEFNFDVGKPTLTCYINGRNKDFEKDVIPNGRPDDWFMFIWSKVDNIGQTTIYSKTYSQLLDEYNELKEKFEYQLENPPDDEDEVVSKDAVLSAKSKADEMKNIFIDKNKITFSTKDFSDIVTYKCSVYVKDEEELDGEEPNYYSIGSGEITLHNKNSIDVPSDYFITITYGDQVFQYSESGVTPASERYSDPLEIMPLQCHFYSPSGLEINQTEYTLKWKVPLENTMIVPPKEGMIQNPANGLFEWYQLREYPLQIAENYDYQAQNNQITAIVTYDNKEFKQSTDLLFVKVGDNGTNGTDIVCKIDISDELDEEDWSLAIEKIYEETDILSNPSIKYQWNNKYYPDYNKPSIAEVKAFTFKAYNRNELLTFDTDVDWSILGIGGLKPSISKEIKVERDSEDNHSAKIFPLETEDEASDFSNQIIQGTTTVTTEYFEDQQNLTEEQKEDRTITQRYYCSYPIPIIDYTVLTTDKTLGKYYNPMGNLINIKLDKTNLLKYVVYNADGRNPLYNKNQGIFFNIYENYALETTTYNLLNEPAILPDDLKYKFYLHFEVQGGANNNKYTSDIKIQTTKNGQIVKAVDPETGAPTEYEKEDPSIEINTVYNKLQGVYVVPNDIYTGAYSNNNVIVDIYYYYYNDNLKPFENSDGTIQSFNQVLTSNKVIHLVHMSIPIQMSLNTFGLASLNAWDGNHIEINEDGNYILAPQIGAGEKDDNNRFTGMVMGTSQTYDMDNRQVGLLGFNKGEQSVWIDAETGKTVLGLPENTNLENEKYNDDYTNRYTQGRIELVPWGTSKIGNWYLGSRSLWNIPIPNLGLAGETEDYWIFPDKKDDEDYLIRENEDYEDVGKNRYPKNGVFTIPPWGEGILLNANPSYISIKGRPLTITRKTLQNGEHTWSGDTDIYYAMHSVDYNGNLLDDNRTSGKSILHPGDSLELQLDPNQSSVFSIFQHTRKKNVEDNVSSDKANDWVRTLRVGIDAYGRFFSNAMKDASVGIAPGFVSAFGKTVEDQYYYGLIVETNADDVAQADTLIKLFTDVRNEDIVYISGSSSDGTNEYNRPLQLYGNSISLYAARSGTGTTSSSYIKVEPNLAEMVSNSPSNYINVTNNGFSAVDGANLFSVIGGKGSYNIGGSQTTVIKGSQTTTVGGSDAHSVGGYFNLTVGGTTSILSSGDVTISKNSSDGTETYGVISISNDTNIISNNGNIGITSGSGRNISITAPASPENGGRIGLTSGNSISLSTQQQIDLTASSNGMINIKGSNGTIFLDDGRESIKISTDVGTAWDSTQSKTNGIAITGNTLFHNVVSFGSAAKHYANMSVAPGNGLYIDEGATIYVNDISTTEGCDTIGSWSVINVGLGSQCVSSYDFYIRQDGMWVSSWIKEVKNLADSLQSQVNSLSGRISALEGSSGTVPYHTHASTETFVVGLNWEDGKVTGVGKETVYTGGPI